MPFWTVIFLAGRMTIPPDIYDAAEVDGATGVRRFVHVTFPLLANLYFICMLLSTLWTVGDFTTVYLVSGGGPHHSTDVLATLGFGYAFDAGKPALGVAAVLSALPVGSLASFAVSRMRLSKGALLTNAALLTYAIPASFLIVPYYRIMHSYGLSDSLWAVIAAQVTFATPFAILILQLYARLIPFELDDAARFDGR